MAMQKNSPRVNHPEGKPSNVSKAHHSSTTQFFTLLINHRTLIAALSLFHGWVFAMSWSGIFVATFKNPIPTSTSSGIWITSLFVCTAVLGSFFLVPRLCERISRKRTILCTCLMSLSTILAMLSSVFPDVAIPLFVASGATSGLGTGIMTAYWGLLITRYDSSIALKFVAVSLLAAALLTMLVSFSPKPMAYVLMALIPFLLIKPFNKTLGFRWFCDERMGIAADSSTSASLKAPESREQKISVSPAAILFFGLAVVLGISAGLLRGFAHIGTHSDSVWIFGFSVICAAIMLLISKVPESGESFALFYRAIAFISIAFVILAVVVQQMEQRVLLALGLHTIGFIYFYGLLWVFCAMYAQRSEIPVRIFVGGFFANQVGQIAGALTGDALGFLVDPNSIVASASNTMIYLLLFSVIILMARLSNASQHRFMVTNDAIESSCTIAAEECNLTRRESEILPYLVKGYDRSFISDNLGISTETVKSHIRHIYEKLDVHSRVELFNTVSQFAKSDVDVESKRQASKNLS